MLMLALCFSLLLGFTSFHLTYIAILSG